METLHKKRSDLGQTDVAQDFQKHNDKNDDSISIESDRVDFDKEEFPDGGFGWVVVLGCSILMGCSWGMVNAYGDFQKYYLAKFPDTSQSLLSLIGSLESFCIDIFSVPASVLITKIGPRKTVMTGGIIVSFSFMMTSLGKELWQLALAQGVTFGIGVSMMVLVCYSLPQEWFKRRRSTATGIVSVGASIGGMLWPLAVQRLLRQVGFAWTNRIFGFIYLPLIAIAVLCLKSRAHELAFNNKVEERPSDDIVDIVYQETAEPKQFENEPVCQSEKAQDVRKNWFRRHIFHSEFLLEWVVLRDPKFCLILLAIGVGNFAIFLPYFYLPSYIKLLSNVSPNVREYILTIINGTSIIGRVIPGIIGDKIGRLNTFCLCTALAGVSLLAFWLPAKSEGLVLTTGITFTIFSSGFFGLAPAVIGQLFGLHRIKSRMTIFMLVCAPGAVSGSVIGGAFLPTAAESFTGSTKGYPKLIIFAGVMFLGSASFLFITKLMISRRLFKVV